MSQSALDIVKTSPERNIDNSWQSMTILDQNWRSVVNKASMQPYIARIKMKKWPLFVDVL